MGEVRRASDKSGGTGASSAPLPLAGGAGEGLFSSARPNTPSPNPSRKREGDKKCSDVEKPYPSSALIAACTRRSASARGNPGGIGSPKRNVTTPACLGPCFGQTSPELIATGITGILSI